MPQVIAARRQPRLAAIAALLLLATPLVATPVRAAAAVTMDVTTGDPQVHVGDVIKFLFEVSNTGDTVLKVGPVSGSLCDSEPSYVSGDTGSDGLMEPAETWLYDCPHNVVELAHFIQNVANVTAIPPGDLPDVTGTDTVQVEVLHPRISMEASVNAPLLIGSQVRYGFGVFNLGDTPLGNIRVTSAACLTPMLGPDNDDGDDGFIAVDMETWFFRCDGPVVSATDTAFHVEGQVEGQDGLEAVVNASASADQVVIHPAITFTTASTSASANPGGTITFTFKLTNTGDEGLHSTTITNTACDAGTFDRGEADDSGFLEPGEVWNGVCTHKVTENVGATVKNVYTFRGFASDIEMNASGETSVTIVAKGASPAPTRVPTAHPSEVPVEPSGSATPSLEPSAGPSVAAATAEPAPTSEPAPTIEPTPASSEAPGLPVVPIVIVIAILAAIAGWVVWQRRRIPSGHEVEL